MDRLQLFTVMPIAVALVLGSMALTTGFHVAYKANDRARGIVMLEAWRLTTAALTPIVEHTRSLLRLFSAVFTPRAGLAAAALVLAMATNADGALFIGVAGIVNFDALERDLASKKSEAETLFAKYAREAEAHEEKDAQGNVVRKGRLLTDDEKKAVQAKIDEGRAIKAQIDRARGDEELRRQIDGMTSGFARQHASAVDAAARETRSRIKSLGQQWAESVAGKFFFEKQHHGGSGWRSPAVELTGHHMLAATLTSDAASGGDLIVPDYRPGILPMLFKRLTVRDLMAQGTTDSNLVSYMKEVTATNAAATVAEGASKPESTLAFDLVSDAVRKIATWLPVTEEMLEDVSQIRSYIDARLRLFVLLVEEDQLLNGDGTPPNISGILDRAGLTAAQARGGDTNADAIFKEMMKIFNASFLMPDAHVLNPTNWQTIQLSKDANGQYYGSGPFAGPQAPTLWGLPVAVTPSIAAGTALSGAFKAASQIFDKGGLRVEASNSHSDYFIKNLVAIRAEERLALAVYREAAFGTTTGLN